jgi:hypothetical protein
MISSILNMISTSQNMFNEVVSSYVHERNTSKDIINKIFLPLR